MPMTLMNYVTSKAGDWATARPASNENTIELTHAEDAVTFQGPLSLNVSFVAESVFTPVGGNGSEPRVSTNDLYSYNLEIPAGYTWRYQMSDSPVITRLMSGYKVIIRPSPCSRPPVTQPPDLPCDFAVGNQPCIGEFFPIGCEPCGNGPVRLPPAACGPSLAVTPALGGCIRPRFFNGMFITREDLETELRYFRIKNQLERKTIGQGVVWGLGLGRNGQSIVVKPGYAIDCCGNDLMVTSHYTVASQTLLSDPAICNLLGRGQQRFHLLLEYVECPEEPRPVHGDPCVGSASACEMSRVRETVRLRLVKPRDYQPSGPITKFLDTINPTARTNSSTTATSPPSATTTTTPADPSTNFTLQFNVKVQQSGAPSGLNQSASPAVRMNSTSNNSDIQLFDRTPTTISVSLTTSGDFTLTGGQLLQTVASGNPNPVATVNPGASPVLQWQFQGGAPIDLPTGGFTATYTLSGWTAAGIAGGPQDGNTLSGSATLTFSYMKSNATEPLNIALATTGVQLTQSPRARFPCLTDPCCPEGTRALFPVTPPWADANPFNPSQPADLKVLELALFYALAVGYHAQGNQKSFQEAILAAFAAIRSLDPSIVTGEEAIPVLIATQQLLADWCCSFLYPGPRCQGEPHGVVIGCATVGSDGITHIDPWSGRRWVVTYPLLSYWGEQIGIVPPDVLASKLFSVICCLAGLGSGLIPSGRDTLKISDVTAQGIPVGAGVLRIGPQVQLRPSQPSTRVETAGLTTFTARLLAALARSPAPAGTPMVDVTLAGYPDVHLIVPDDAATPVPPPTFDRTTGLVRDALAVPALRTATPPLLRSFAESLATRLTGATPVSAINPAQPIVAPLTAAGITTVGDVLARTPDSIYSGVLGKKQAPAVSELITRAEARAEDVAKNVVDALKQTAGRRTLVSTDDLVVAETRKALVQALAAATKLPEATVDAGVMESLK